MNYKTEQGERAMLYDVQSSPLGEILVAKDDGGLRALSFLEGRNPVVPGGGWQRDVGALKPAFEQIRAYFAGELKVFDLPLAPRGTPFQQKVWQALLRIPYGATVSYQDVAVMIDNPKAVRAVGGANGANPIALIIPCHRVIGKNGKLVGYGGGLFLKSHLLDLEASGVTTP